MQLIGKGEEASVYLDENGRVVWVMDGLEAHDTAYIGWRLCKDRLGPPHFPLVHEIERQEGKLHVAMEYVPPGRPTAWNEEQAQAILRELREANIFHRDIRPEHLVVRPTGEWCLLDFGWACDYGNVYSTPRALGGRYRKGGKPDDAHAMKMIRKEMEGRDE